MGTLAGELHLSKSELRDGVAYTMIDFVGETWEEASDEDKNYYRDNARYIFMLFEDDLFSFCVIVVGNAYIVNGKVAEAQGYLDEAKVQLRSLGENYSDYEHYPALKGYYTTTVSYFEFCQDPTGSFNQVKTTIGNYRDTIRGYKSDLKYAFED